MRKFSGSGRPRLLWFRVCVLAENAPYVWDIVSQKFVATSRWLRLAQGPRGSVASAACRLMLTDSAGALLSYTLYTVLSRLFRGPVLPEQFGANIIS